MKSALLAAFSTLVGWPIVAEAIPHDPVSAWLRYCMADPSCEFRWDRLEVIGEVIGWLFAAVVCLLLAGSFVGYLIDWLRWIREGGKTHRQ